MAFTDEEARVARNIRTIAEKFQSSRLCEVPVLLHLAVTRQESQWNETAAAHTPYEDSYSVYQLNERAHPGASVYAPSPWCDYGFWEIYQRWSEAWTDTLASQWADLGKRGEIVEAFAPSAQGSIAWPRGLGAERYAEAVAMLELIS